MNTPLTHFNYLLTFGKETALTAMDSAARLQLMERVVRSGPSEEAWRALLELMASWPEDPEKAIAFGQLDASLAPWEDKVRHVNSAWTFIYAPDGQLSSLARIIRSVSISHREQYGNKELKGIVTTPDIRELRMLNIHKSEIYLEGWKALADSPHLGRLSFLSLEGLTFSDEKFDVLFSAAGLRSLDRLRLKDVNLNLPRLNRLLRSPLIRTVHQLELPYNNLDKAAVLALAKGLRPGLQITTE